MAIYLFELASVYYTTKFSLPKFWNSWKKIQRNDRDHNINFITDKIDIRECGLGLV